MTEMSVDASKISVRKITDTVRHPPVYTAARTVWMRPYGVSVLTFVIPAMLEASDHWYLRVSYVR